MIITLSQPWECNETPIIYKIYSGEILQTKLETTVWFEMIKIATTVRGQITDLLY